MKKQTLLYIIFGLMILGGLALFAGMRRDSDAQTSESEPAMETSQGATPTGDGESHPKGSGAPHYDGLDHVNIPSSLASAEKIYEGFRVSFNADNHTPNWVAWELLGTRTDGPTSRSNKFWTDTELEGCPSTRDYTRSGYDRGHMCPAADQKWSPRAMEDCFTMANIIPQDHDLNSGAWKTLENKERLWAQRDSAIVIVAGPIYSETDNRRIGETGVRVPGACFKVLAAPYANPPRAIAFVYPNMTAPGNMENYVMTVDELEELTGYDFLHALPDPIENEIESKASFKAWNRR